MISVIIPAQDEEGLVGAAVESARSEPGVEVIVVDGRSGDGTAREAAAAGARVLAAPPGRARQMNAGAAAAAGDILLFLHADTRLPGGWGRLARETLARPGVAAGAFRLGIGAPGATLRLIEAMANLRSRFLQCPYGDQALFMTAARFGESGGFPDLPILEDYVLVRRLRERGRVALAPAAVTTSARRWRRLGPWRTTFTNWGIFAAHRLGVAPERLARWY